MFVGQQFLQDVLAYSTFDAGVAILPAAFLMVIVAPRSAKIVEARGDRFTSSRRICSACSGSLRCCSCGTRGARIGRSGSGTRTSVRASASRGPRPHTRSPARSRSSAPARRRGRPISSVISEARSCSRSSVRCGGRLPGVLHGVDRRLAGRPEGVRQRRGAADQVVRGRRGGRPAVPKYADQITAAAKTSFLSGSSGPTSRASLQSGSARRSSSSRSRGRVRSAAPRRIPTRGLVVGRIRRRIMMKRSHGRPRDAQAPLTPSAS